MYIFPVQKEAKSVKISLTNGENDGVDRGGDRRKPVTEDRRENYPRVKTLYSV